MLKCVYLGYDEQLLFRNIVIEKSDRFKIILEGITDQVLNSYNQYLFLFDNLQSKVNSEFNDIDQKKALKVCYSSSIASFEFAKGQIFRAQPKQLKAFCPYCLLDRPKTLDHYIGQTEFPEYSTLIRNLIPCCYKCNQKKDEKWRKNNLRRFIHFYNDDFFNHKFLYANLIFQPNNNVPEIQFYLNCPDEMSEANYNIIQWHFEDLDLLKDYSERVNALVSSTMESILTKLNVGISLELIRTLLKSDAVSFAKEFGVNYWHAAMYEAIADNLEQFINQIK